MYAPIDGRIGEARVKVGNLVGPDPAGGGAFTDLATIQQLDPMGVDIRLSSRDLDRTTALIEGGLAVRLTRPGPAGPQEHPYEGRVLLHRQHGRRDHLDLPGQGPGSPTPAASSCPGEYVKVRMVVDRLENAVVVPAPSVVESESGTIVHVVDGEGKVAVRRVVAGQAHEGLRVITKGLDAGVPVIVDGLQMIRPGPPGQDRAGRADPARSRRDRRSRRRTPWPRRSRNPSARLSRSRRSRHRSRSDPPWEPDGHGRLLHPPADLRHGLGPPDAPDRRDLRVPAADRAVSPGRPAPGPGDDHLHRGRRPERRPDGDHADRAADQRHQGDDLLQLRQHQQRRVEHRGHVRRRLLAGHGRRRHPEPGADGPGAAPARGQAVRRVDQEDVDRHGLRRQPDLARRPVRRQLPGQLRPDLRRRRPEADQRGQRRQRARAASTRCGSGSTPTAWPT